MMSPDILAKIKQIEIHTRRLLSGSLIGDYRSAQKGFGLEFDQIREYQQGDDVRFIDWNGSARMGKLLVKQYIEERSRLIVLAVDVSGSTAFSSQATLKADVIAQIASLLALVADQGNDQVSLILFADEIVSVIPPGKGRIHTKRVMETVFNQPARTAKTNLSTVLEYLGAMKRKDAIVFVISDFIDDNFDKPLRLAARRHEMVAVRCLDPLEHGLPRLGMIPLYDAETGATCMVDTRKAHKGVHAMLKGRVSDQGLLFRKYGIDVLDIALERPFMHDLMQFFRRRMRY